MAAKQENQEMTSGYMAPETYLLILKYRPQKDKPCYSKLLFAWSRDSTMAILPDRILNIPDKIHPIPYKNCTICDKNLNISDKILSKADRIAAPDDRKVKISC